MSVIIFKKDGSYEERPKREPRKPAIPPSCKECGSTDMKQDRASGEGTTLVAYASPPGHDHDDNCRQRRYACEKGHYNWYSAVNHCQTDGCEWSGKTDCFCSGPKWTHWP